MGIYAVLKTKGYMCSRKRVARCMQKLGLRALMNKKFTPRKKTFMESFPDHLQQNFETSCPNTVWAADISYIKTHEGWLYLAVILDLFSRKVIGFSIQDHL
jgi:putative transposase